MSTSNNAWPSRYKSCPWGIYSICACCNIILNWHLMSTLWHNPNKIKTLSITHQYLPHRLYLKYQPQLREEGLCLPNRPMSFGLALCLSVSLTMTSWRWNNQRTAEPRPGPDSGESAVSGLWSSRCGAGWYWKTEIRTRWIHWMHLIIIRLQSATLSNV